MPYVERFITTWLRPDVPVSGGPDSPWVHAKKSDKDCRHMPWFTNIYRNTLNRPSHFKLFIKTKQNKKFTTYLGHHKAQVVVVHLHFFFLPIWVINTTDWWWFCDTINQCNLTSDIFSLVHYFRFPKSEELWIFSMLISLQHVVVRHSLVRCISYQMCWDLGCLYDNYFSLSWISCIVWISGCSLQSFKISFIFL